MYIWLAAPCSKGSYPFVFFLLYVLYLLSSPTIGFLLLLRRRRLTFCPCCPSFLLPTTTTIFFKTFASSFQFTTNHNRFFSRSIDDDDHDVSSCLYAHRRPPNFRSSSLFTPTPSTISNPSQRFSIDGIVKDFAGGTRFFVFTNKPGTNKTVSCSTSGQFARRRIRLAKGDGVRIEFSPYDLNNGIIVERYSDAPQNLVNLLEVEKRAEAIRKKTQLRQHKK